MHILRRRGWEVSERLVTPEALVLGRRAALAGAGSVALAAPALAQAAAAPERNPKYVAGREITPEKYATTYNNYYEFSEGKNLWEAAQVIKPRPWTISLEGQLKEPRTIAIDDLLKQVQVEERVYRHRCVEAWAMTVPWTGFPLSQLLKIAEPLGSAKYIVFETAQDPKMPGLQSPFYPWPYIEGLALDEAANDLAFISTGMYGKSAAAAGRRADPADGAVEIRLQVGQGPGEDQLYREAAGELLAGNPAFGVWLLGQCEPGRVASSLEPGAGAAAGQQRDGADADLQRLWRIRRVALQRPEK